MSIPHKDAPFDILPWNGFKAALSLTFDDGEPHHLELAIPELDRRNLKATFYVMPEHGLPLKDGWQAAFRQGHEPGNHSLTHPNPQGFTREDCLREINGAQTAFFDVIGVVPPTFAYPYTVLTPEYREVLASRFVVARGGGNFLVSRDGPTDWLNLPCVATMTAKPLAEYTDWIARARDSGGLLVFMIHGIEGSPWGWEPIALTVYEGLLDHIADQQDLWVAPLGVTAAYARARELVSAALAAWLARRSNNDGLGVENRIQWDVPSFMPRGTLLKVRLRPGTNISLVQDGSVLEADRDGSVQVRFDSGFVECLAP